MEIMDVQAKEASSKVGMVQRSAGGKADDREVQMGDMGSILAASETTIGSSEIEKP